MLNLHISFCNIVKKERKKERKNCCFKVVENVGSGLEMKHWSLTGMGEQQHSEKLGNIITNDPTYKQTNKQRK